MNTKTPDKKMNKSRLGKLTLQKDIFDTALKDNLKSTVDITALFNHFGVKLVQKGKSHIGLCPWHDDSTPSLSVDKTKGLYNCFGCGESGDIFTLTEKMKGCDFNGAMEFLKGFAATGLDAGSAFKRASQNIRPVLSAEEVEDDVVVEDVLDDTDLITTEEPKEKANETQQQNEDKSGLTEIQQVNPDKKSDALPDILQASPDKNGDTVSKDIFNLNTVADYYHKKLAANKNAMEYLKARGITNEAISHFRIGFCDSTLKEKVGAEGFEKLKSKGLFTEKGYELFSNCIVVPLTNSNDQVLSFYGRSIIPRAKVQHLYLTGKHKAVFNEKAYRVYDQIILTESVIDALSLFSVGIHNVSCIYGTNGLTDLHITAMYEHLVPEVVLALDNDEAGRKAAKNHRDQLVDEDRRVKIIFPEGKDWNEDLTSGSLRKGAVLEQIKNAQLHRQEKTGRVFRKTDAGLVLTHEDMTYTVKQDTSSRLSVRCEMDGEVFYDRVDLVSSRSRTSFAGNVSRIFDTETKRIEKDLIALLEYLEDETDKRSQETEEEIILTEEEKALGLSFLTNPNMFDEIVKDTDVLGYVGEETNKKLMYLAATSRLLDDPISILILSESGSGKSYLVDTIKKLIPPEDVIDVTSLSDQALNYMCDLEHKFLSLSEAVHKDVIEHQLREMVSKKELSRLVTKKNEKTGAMRTEQVKVKAVVSLVMSSTNFNVNPENASRAFLMYADESEEQTSRIYEQQTMKRTFETQKRREQMEPEVIRKHYAAQRMLQNYMVVSHFDTGRFFPKSMMRFRRDHERFVDLIAAVCFLRQYQKQVKEKDGMLYIECDYTDYEIARELLIDGVLKQALLELPKGAVKVYEAFRKLARKRSLKKDISPEDAQVTQRDLREYSGLGHGCIKQHIRLLVEYEYILKHGGSMRGSRSYYTLRKDEPLNRIKELCIPTAAEYRENLNKKT